MQVAELKAGVPDAPLQYDFELPHTDVVVTAHRAVCFMDDRHINVFGLSRAAADTRSADLPQSSIKRARVSAIAPHSAATEAEASDVKGSTLLAGIVNGAPRSKLTCEQCFDLVAATAFNHATPIIKMLPGYVRPLLMEAPMAEVCPSAYETVPHASEVHCSQMLHSHLHPSALHRKGSIVVCPAWLDKSLLLIRSA